MSYGTDEAEMFRGAASYVDRILKSERPADIPRADERLTIAFASLPPWDPRADAYSGRSVAAQGCQGVKGAMGFQASLCGTLKGP
jgi:hypothetical protein